MDVLIDRAVTRTNERTACAGDPASFKAALAEELHRETSRERWVWQRGLTRAPGFSVFSKALETAPDADRISFSPRDDLFSDLTLWHSVILTLAGPCSTFEVAGVRVGSDKFDHFLDEGYEYWVRSSDGADPTPGLERGTRTERTLYGLLTSKTFSWADLRANWDGYRFYDELLTDTSMIGRDERGCAVRTRPFRWSEWIDPEWDEILNPPAHTRLVERGVLGWLEDHRDEVCAARERWDPSGAREGFLASLEVDPSYTAGPHPARRDPYQLAALCDPERVAPLEPHPVRTRAQVRIDRQDRADARSRR